MSEEAKMQEQNNKAVSIVTSYTQIPYSVFATEVEGTTKKDYFNEMTEIMKYYEDYEQGVEFFSEGSGGDYIPSGTRYKKIHNLIDKEARFLFSIPPTFTVNKDLEEVSDQLKKDSSILNDLVNNVLTRNAFNSRLVQAAKDCFIGKRVAVMLNFNNTEGITVTFLKSTEFLYEMTGNVLNKIVAIYILNDASNKAEQIIKKKKYEMHDDGFCYVTEALYNGAGELLEEGRIDEMKTEFQTIPAVVILNDGLVNNRKGESEVKLLRDNEYDFSKMSNADVDSLRKSMNPIRYTIDASANSTSNLSSSPGSFWDLQSRDDGSDPHQATTGLLEANMNYSNALKTTLDRIDNEMYSMLEIPNINSEKLQGVITSGKTLKALYWSLIVRCNEKMLTWGPALQRIAELIIEGVWLYPDSNIGYTQEQVPQTEFDVFVENNYPIPEDEIEEKSVDLAEVAAQVMSRKAYMKKWRNLTDKECDAELQQIAKERQLLEDSWSDGMMDNQQQNQFGNEQ